MMRTRIIFFGCLGLVLLLISGAAILLVAQIPDVAEQLPPNALALVVTVTAPRNQADVPVDTFTTINAEAVGAQTIAALELWVDGALIEAKKSPSANLMQWGAFWTWMPEGEGPHALLVRATDANQRVATSNVVRVNATKEENAARDLTYQVQAGDNLPAIAQKLGVPLQEIVELNPQLDPNKPLTPGQSIPISIPPPTPPAPPPPVPTATLAPATPSGPLTSPGSGARIPFWLGKNLFGLVRPARIPAPPRLALQANQCNVQLFITDPSDNEDGFFVYRLDPQASAFKRIATLGANSGATPITFADANRYGQFDYYVGAFNPAGESPSNIARVNISLANCATPQTAGIQITNGKIVVTQPVDKVYCYISINGGAWTRIPPAPQTFIQPVKGAFDISVYLKTIALPPGTVSIDLECWGWQGNTLVYLGQVKATMDSSQPGSLHQISGDRFKFIAELSNPAILKDLPLARTPLPYIFQPFKLTLTGNPQLCAEHLNPVVAAFGGVLACQAAIENKYVVLVWKWDTLDGYSSIDKPNIEYQVIKDIDGYHVYQIDLLAQRHLLTTVSNGPEQTVAMFPSPPASDIFVGLGIPRVRKPPCFVVRAFKGSVESDDSNTFCLTSDIPGLKTARLAPALVKSVRAVNLDWSHAAYCNITPMNDSLNRELPRTGEIWVGYSHYWDSGTDPFPCWEKQNYAFRGLVKFDTSAIAAVQQATLVYKNIDSYYTYRTASDFGWDSCALYLLMATAEHFDQNDLGEGETYTKLPRKGQRTNANPLEGREEEFRIDVTAPIRQWLAFGKNYGFIFRSVDERLDVETNSYCRSKYAGFELEITYFGK